MESAKEAISKFTSRHGHTTEVDERVQPAVTSETVKPTRHENITQAVDREVHQHHHHTTVQPLEHQEMLPEKHSHNMVPVENREFHHGNDSETKERLQMEAAKFKDTSRTHETHHTQAALPTAQGEHVHHHVHETVQPVIHKETVQPEVVHTTVPIHETHHASAQHHGTSVLPMKNLSEFSGQSTGTRHEEYEGVPRSYNKSMQQGQTDSDMNPMKKGVDGPDSHHTGGTNLSGTEAFRDDGHMVKPGQGGSAGGYGTQGTPASGYTGREGGITDRENTSGMRTGNQGYGNSVTMDRDGTSGMRTGDQGYGNSAMTDTRDDFSGGGSTGKKPSLMDKLNPKVDSNGDGKAGFMK